MIKLLRMSKWQSQSCIFSVCFLCIGVLLVVAACCEASHTSGFCQCHTPFVGASSINLEFMETMSSTSRTAVQPCPVGLGIPLTFKNISLSPIPYILVSEVLGEFLHGLSTESQECNASLPMALSPCLLWIPIEFPQAEWFYPCWCFLLVFHDETRSKIVDNNSKPCHLLVSYK